MQVLLISKVVLVVLLRRIRGVFVCRSGQGCRRAWRDATTGAMVQTVLYFSSFCSCSSWAWMLTCPLLCNDRCPVFCRQSAVQFFWTRMLSCPLCNDTLWPRQCEYCLEITQLQFLDMFVMPSSCNDRCPVFCGHSADAVLGHGC